jgi:hypothetical protein
MGMVSWTLVFFTRESLRNRKIQGMWADIIGIFSQSLYGLTMVMD